MGVLFFVEASRLLCFQTGKAEADADTALYPVRAGKKYE